MDVCWGLDSESTCVYVHGFINKSFKGPTFDQKTRTPQWKNLLRNLRKELKAKLPQKACGQNKCEQKHVINHDDKIS